MRRLARWGGWCRSGIGGSRRGDTKPGECGQVVALYVLFLFAMLGMAGLVIDFGHWYQDKQAVQAEVDAAALAGASTLPSGWSTAQSTAAAQLAKNGKAGDSPTYTNTTNQTPPRLGHGHRHPPVDAPSSPRCSASTRSP